MDGTPQTNGAVFPPTRASLLDLAGRRDSPDCRAAWERFFRTYGPPLYCWLRRTGSPPEEALDLLQEFFLEGLAILSQYDPARGRLRTFLVACLRNLRTDLRRHEQARPDRQPLPFDVSEPIDARSPVDPEEGLNEEWARQAIRRALAAVEEDLAGREDAVSLRILKEYVLDAAHGAASELASRIGITRGDLYTRATRLRQAIAVEVEREVASYSLGGVADREECDALLRRIPSHF